MSLVPYTPGAVGSVSNVNDMFNMIANWARNARNYGNQRAQIPWTQEWMNARAYKNFMEGKPKSKGKKTTTVKATRQMTRRNGKKRRTTSRRRKASRSKKRIRGTRIRSGLRVRHARVAKVFNKPPKQIGYFPLLTARRRRAVNAWHTSDTNTASRILANANECKYDHKLVGVGSTMDGFMGEFQQRTALGADETVDLRAMNNARMAYKATGQLQMRNNAGTDARVMVYYITYKDNATANPTTVLGFSLADYYANATSVPADASVLINSYPEQGHYFQSIFRIWKKEKFIMQPGDEISLKYETPWIEYDPELHDNNASSYYAGTTTGILIRLQGTIGHGEAEVSDVGYTAATLDVIEHVKHVYGYLTSTEVIRHSVSNTVQDAEVAANESGEKVTDNPQ